VARFVIQVFKTMGSQVWTNRYFVSAPDLNAAITAATIIRDHEILIHKNQVTISSVRTSDTDPNTDVFNVAPLANLGTAGNIADMIPLFNTVRVDLGVSGFGRPSRKYYRMPLDEADQSNGSLAAGIITLFNNTLTDLIGDLAANSTPLVDPDDQLITSASTRSPVQMRQLHRRKRRVSAPA